MTDIANRLKLLRKEGHQIISPTFTILYNPYIDTFLLDVPEDKKDLALKVEELEDIYYWTVADYTPYRSSSMATTQMHGVSFNPMRKERQ